MGSIRTMNMGGSEIVLDCGRRHTHKNGQKTRINYEEGQYAVCLWLQSKEEDVQEEAEKVMNGNRFAILATGR